MTVVLNVNDREIPRYVNQQMLERGGYEVVSAANGIDALAMVRDPSHGIEVVLLDVQLPDLDGFEICHRLKSDPATANLVVLMTSATFVTAKNKVLGLDSGADGYLVQPYEAAELYATLRSLLRTRAAEKRASALADDLRAAMEVRDEFLAMLGHELRNPLSAIATALQVMDERPQDDSSRFRAVLTRQTANLTRIVDDLLDVARITRGKITLARAPIDLRDIAQRCTTAHAEDARRAGHELVLSLPDAPVVVSGDVVRLEQITANLITNAIKYTPRGGTIRVEVSGTDTRARIAVTDNGIGMSPDMCGRVFDVFVQAKQSIERSRGGLGLGLTVVRQLVELHGGAVSAHSDGEGKGSRFVVDLPRIAAEARAEEREDAAAGPQMRALKIVVIEDNDDARETLAQALAMLNHDVASAADGSRGLALVLEKRPEVVLMDIGLPQIDGYELARRIRDQLNGRAPHLIAMTGYGQPEDRERAVRAGFDLHLVKPLSIPMLKRVLAAVPPR